MKVKSFRNVFCMVTLLTLTSSAYAQLTSTGGGVAQPLNVADGSSYTLPIVLTSNITLAGGVRQKYTISGNISGNFGILTPSPPSNYFTLLLTGTNTHTGVTQINSINLGGTGSSVNSRHEVFSSSTIFGGVGTGDAGVYRAGDLEFKLGSRLVVYGTTMAASKVVCNELSLSTPSSLSVDVQDNIGPGRYTILEYTSGPTAGALAPSLGFKNASISSVCFQWEGTSLIMTIGDQSLDPFLGEDPLQFCLDSRVSVTLPTLRTTGVGVVTGLTSRLSVAWDPINETVVISGIVDNPPRSFGSIPDNYEIVIPLIGTGCVKTERRRITVLRKPNPPAVQVLGGPPTCNPGPGVYLSFSNLPFGVWTLTPNDGVEDLPSITSSGYQYNVMDGLVPNTTYSAKVTDDRGCTSESSTTLSSNGTATIPAPEIPFLGASSLNYSVCQGFNSAEILIYPLNWTSTVSRAGYSIAFDDDAKRIGFVDVTRGVYASSSRTFTISVPPNAPLGTYAASVIVKNLDTGCESAPHPIRIIVSPLPNPGEIGSSHTICYGGDPASFSEIAAASGVGGTITYQWQYYNDWSLSWENVGTTGAQSAVFDHNTGLYASHTYRRIARLWGCEAASNTVTVTVNQLPQINIAQPAVACSPNTVNLTTSAVATVGGVGTLTKGYFTNASATAVFATPEAASSGTYYIKVTDTQSPACSAVSAPIIVQVSPRPNIPSVGAVTHPVCPSTTGVVALSGLPSSWTVIPNNGASDLPPITGRTISATISGLPGDAEYTFVVKDANCRSAPTDRVAINAVSGVPTIALGANPSVCVGANAVELHYTTSGNPDQYSIVYDDAAVRERFRDVSNGSLSASPISLQVPSDARVDTYNATLTVRASGSNCTSAAVNFTITVNAFPTITGPSVICGPNATITLRANDIGTGIRLPSWARVTGSTATVPAGVSALSASITSVASGVGANGFTFTDSHGCTSSPYTVTVNAAPTISGSAVICGPDAAITLAANDLGTGANTPSWTHVSGNTATLPTRVSTQFALITSSPAGVGPNRFTFTDSYGCTSSPHTVTVNMKPIINGPSVICGPDAAITLLANDAGTGGNTPSWARVTGNTATVPIGISALSAPVTSVASGIGENGFTFTDSYGCTSSPYTVTVNPLPTITGPNVICGSSTTIALTANELGTGTMTPTWVRTAGGTATIPTGISALSVAVTSVTSGTGMNRFAFTDTYGCTSSPYNVAVNVLPTINGPSVICGPSTTITLNANALGTGTATASWASLGGTTATLPTGISALSVSVTSAAAGVGANRIVFTDSHGCTSLPHTVRVSVLPIITGPSIICGPDAAITLIANDIGTGPSTPLWARVSGSTATVPSGSTTFFALATSAASGTGANQFTYTDTYGCTSLPYTVTVNALPTITGPTAICGPSTTITLNANALGTGTVTASWARVRGNTATVPTGISTLSASVTSAASNTGSNAFTFTDSFGCISSPHTVMVSVLPLITGPTVICGPEAAITLSANDIGTGAGLPSWARVTGNTATVLTDISTVSATVTSLPSGTGLNGFTFTDSNGCTSLPYTVAVNPLPTVAGPSIVCGPNSTITLNAATLGVGTVVASWARVAGTTATVPTGISALFAVVSSTSSGTGINRFTFTDSHGCTSLPHSVTVNALPTIIGPSVICGPNAAIALTANDIGTGVNTPTWAQTTGNTASVPTGISTLSALVTSTSSGTGENGFTFTDSHGCTSSPHAVAVSALPTVTGVNVLCGSGATTTLRANELGAGASTPFWARVTGNTATVPVGISTPFALVTSASSSTGENGFTFTDTRGCQSLPFVVTVNALPTITGPAAICGSNTTVTLIANALGSGTAIASWARVRGNTANVPIGISTLSAPITSAASGIGANGFTFTDTNGCTSLPYAVTVNVLPTVAGPSIICGPDAEITLRANELGVGASTPFWARVTGNTASVPAGISTLFAQITSAASGTGENGFTFTDRNGCTSAPYTVTVKALPTITGPSVICGPSTTITLEANGFGTGTAIPSWVRAAGGTATIPAGISTLSVPVTSLASGTGANGFTFTDSDGCTSLPYSVLVHSFPNPGAIASSQTICNGGDPAPITEVAAASIAVGDVRYQWESSPAGSFIPTIIVGAVGTSYDIPEGLTATTQYRRVAISETCASPSAPVQVTVSSSTTPATITLTSTENTPNQLACASLAITPIVYATSGATGAFATGLPTGINGRWEANVFTISGVATAGAGTYPYAVEMTGGCGTISASGIITVTTTATPNTITLVSPAGTPTQLTCTSAAIAPIRYATTGATGATVTGLPNGITGIWQSNIFTISGTASAIAGVYPYTINMTGGCGTNTATGAVSVASTPNTITLTSDPTTATQSACSAFEITPITYATTGATGAVATGLPTGITGRWESNVFTISGTPTALAGAYQYLVNMTGGCGTNTATGTITVAATATPNSITLTSAPNTSTQLACTTVAITPITYGTTGATGATATGLPAGITGLWVANVFTITGTATADAGAFPYIVSLTGGCGITTASGLITVTTAARPNTITLISGPSTPTQSVCSTLAITPITYATTGATGATATGLPAGISGVWTSNVFTISGTATAVAGAYPYVVTMTGGCGTNTARGTITITELANRLTSGPLTNAQTLCANSAIADIVYNLPSATSYSISWAGTASPNSVPAGIVVGPIGASQNIVISGTPTVTGSFGYTIVPVGGCDRSDLKGSITVGTDVSSVVISASEQVLCQGERLQISSAVANAGSDITYQWLRDNIPIVGANSSFEIASVFKLDAGSYALKASGLCGSAISNSISVRVTDDAYFTRVNASISSSSSSPRYNELVSFRYNGLEAVSYSWDFGRGGKGSTLPDPQFIFYNPGEYLVKLLVKRDAPGLCFATLTTRVNVQSANIEVITADPQSSSHLALSCYPNPFSGTLIVEANEPIVTCRFFDLQGREILTFDGGTKVASIATEELALGVYILAVKTTHEEKRIRIIKQ